MAAQIALTLAVLLLAPEPTPQPENGDTEPPTQEGEPQDEGEGEPDGETPDPQTEGEDETAPAPARESTIDAAQAQALQAKARELRDQLFKARARVAIVGSKLFKSRLTLELRSNIERFYTVSDMTITVDGAPVFTRDKGMPPTAGNVFELFAAPGAHELGVSADLVARRDSTYKIKVNKTFTVVVPDDSTVSTRLVMRETGNMWRFAKRRRGRYDVRLRLRAKAKSNSRKRGRLGRGSASVKAGSGSK